MGIVTIAALVIGVPALNVTVFPRDGSVTVGIQSFEPEKIIGNRLWSESPVQILNTFMADQTFFYGVGREGEGGLPFANRLVLSFGEERVDQSSLPADLRSTLSEEDLQALLKFIQTLSYRSFEPCPHDATQECTIAVGWNRARTKEPGMRLIAARITDDIYLITDDSVLKLRSQ